MALWTPADLPSGVVLAWWDAATPASLGITSGSVDSWTSLSSGAQVLSSTSTARPTFNANGLSSGMPGVVFDGVNDVLSMNAALGLYAQGSMTMMMVMKTGAVSTNQRLFSEGLSTSSTNIYAPGSVTSDSTSNQSLGLIRNNAGADALVNQAASYSTGFNPWNTGPHILGLTDTGSSMLGHMDGLSGTKIGGAAQTSAPYPYTRNPPLTLNRFALGALIRSNLAAWLGVTFSEVLFTSRDLTQTEREHVEGYLFHRWKSAFDAAGVTLPGGHPFASAAPTTGPSPITGAATITLDALTTTATGTLPITGAASVTLGALTTVSAAKLPITGTGGGQLGALTTTATGKLSITGAANITLGALQSTGSGVLPIDGDASVTLGELTLSATGKLAITGSASITLGELTTISAGEIVAPGGGSANITLGELTVSATGVLPIAGYASITLGEMTLVSAGTLTDAPVGVPRIVVTLPARTHRLHTVPPREPRQFSVPAKRRHFTVTKRIVVQ